MYKRQQKLAVSAAVFALLAGCGGGGGGDAATPAPAATTPAATAPVVPTPAPVTTTPVTAAPVVTTPAPVTTTPVTPAPVVTTPAPVTTTPVTPAPVVATPTAVPPTSTTIPDPAPISTIAVPPNTSPVNTASPCFNEANLVVGTKIDTADKITYSDGGSAVVSNSMTVQPATTFNSVLVLAAKGTNIYTPDSAALARGYEAVTLGVTSYYDYDRATYTLKEYGNLIISDAGSAILLNSPSIETRFGLAPGAGFTQTSTLSSDLTTPSGAHLLSTQRSTKTVTFVGIEFVTVPAGTFKACKFIESGTTTLGGAPAGTVITDPLSTQWVSVGSGIPVKGLIQEFSRTGAVISTETTELTRATINGQLVTP
jgi:hypothetical protein